MRLLGKVLPRGGEFFVERQVAPLSPHTRGDLGLGVALDHPLGHRGRARTKPTLLLGLPELQLIPTACPCPCHRGEQE